MKLQSPLFHQGLISLLKYKLKTIFLIFLTLQLFTDVTSEGLKRQKRFIYFNSASPIDIGMLLTLPLTFALPTFNLHGGFRRLKRSSAGNMSSEDVLPRESYDDPAYSAELRKLTEYFTLLDIEEDICQQRVVCEIFANSEKFFPVSEILLKRLTVNRGSVQPTPSNRYFRYVKAMEEGMISGGDNCPQLFAACPYSAEEKLNMPVLAVWSQLSNLLRIQFHENE